METAATPSRESLGPARQPPVRTPKIVPAEVMRAAKRMFLASGSLEMRALARQLGVGRATLYRWNGGREELLSEVLLSLALANLARAEADVTTEPGPRRFCDVHDLHLQRISDNVSLRSFVRSEPDAALRVLLDANGRVHLGVTRALADFVRRQEVASGWTAPLGPDGLAAVVSRLSEAFIYGDLIARAFPDAATPDVVLRMMLGVPPPGA
jgi:AcrR family transcriptional regulator